MRRRWTSCLTVIDSEMNSDTVTKPGLKESGCVNWSQISESGEKLIEMVEVTDVEPVSLTVNMNRRRMFKTMNENFFT